MEECIEPLFLEQEAWEAAEKERVAQAEAEAKAIAQAWEAHRDDESGATYFYNALTYDTVWEQPPDFAGEIFEHIISGEHESQG